MSTLTAYDKFIQQALKYGFSLFGLPKTGQTTEYQSGDDGTYQKGYPKTGARFTDNGDGTITDNATGLDWVADPSAIGTVGGYNWGTTGSPNHFLWANALLAITDLNTANYAGHNDWRLPNVKELRSLVNYGNWSPAIGEATVGGSGSGAPFTNTQTSGYWSSTTFAADTVSAWYIFFNYGYVNFGGKDFGNYYVRPVRGGA